MVQSKAEESATDEAVKNGTMSILFNGTKRRRPVHDHVKTEDEAKAIKAELEGGADFATLAKAKAVMSEQANVGNKFVIRTFS